jgi:phosphoglycerate dehydrogenase-like enzyme
MISDRRQNNLLILSQDSEDYKHLIEAASLPGLSILSTNQPDQAIQQGSHADLLLGEPSLVSKVLNSLPQIKWVQTTWAGIEPLLADGMRRDYLLTNARNVYGSMMSEYVFGYLLLIERRILPRWQSQGAGKWDERPNGTLRGKLLGLMGVGTIGSHIAQTAKHFGMIVYGYTRETETCAYVDKYFHPAELAQFVQDLDYLVCTLPGTPATRGLVDHLFLDALPKKTWLINVGRGSTINETALADALNNGTLAGAVLDVFTQEPLPANHPLWSTPHTFITSHTAARNYLPDIASLFVQNYQRLIRGEPLLYQVDFNQGY